MIGDYLLCGWRVRSGLPLPELPPWTGPDDVPVDVTITEGEAPDRLESAAFSGKFLMVGRGAVLLHIPGLVRLLVRDGRDVRVQILRDEAEDGWRLFVLGAGLSYLCHQRGLFPLHAATLRMGGRTVAFAGASGAGKSTLAMALVRRGHRLLSDDVTVLRVPPEGCPMVLPAWPRLKLWRDAVENFGLVAGDLLRVRQGMDKFNLPPEAAFDTSQTPLDAVIMLGEGAAPTVRTLSPKTAVPGLQASVHRYKTAVHLGRQGALLAQSVAVARNVPFWQLERPKTFASLDRTASLLEERLQS